jgi:hypothetical protein
LIHSEVQGRREEKFPERMFTYSYRIFDVYHWPVVSLAVLCDADAGWRPDHFGYNIWGCKIDQIRKVARAVKKAKNVDEIRRSLP